MADYSTSKPAGTSEVQVDGSVRQGGQFPDGALTSPWGRLEPLMDPENLKSRFLKGIPMQLRIKDPTTGDFFRITDGELKDYIERSVDIAEGQTGLTIMPLQFLQKLSYSKLDFDAWGYFQLEHKPVQSIETLRVTLADGSQAFEFPHEWIETTNLMRGQLNIVPLAYAVLNGGQGFTGNTGANGTAVWFNVYWAKNWIPALFGIQYTAGFRNGLVPKIVNELIGTLAAMRTLSQIAAAYAHISSASLGLDGMSQSTSTPGPQRYALRMQELEAERKDLIKKIRKATRSGIAAGTV